MKLSEWWPFQRKTRDIMRPRVILNSVVSRMLVLLCDLQLNSVGVRVYYWSLAVFTVNVCERFAGEQSTMCSRNYCRCHSWMQTLEL